MLKNRIYQVLDPHVIQQNRLSKPDYPFQTTAHANLQRKPSNPSHTNASRTNSYNNNVHTPLASRSSYPSPQLTSGQINPSPHQSNTPTTNQQIYSPPTMPGSKQQNQTVPLTSNPGLFTPSIAQQAPQSTINTQSFKANLSYLNLFSIFYKF